MRKKTCDRPAAAATAAPRPSPATAAAAVALSHFFTLPYKVNETKELLDSKCCQNFATCTSGWAGFVNNPLLMGSLETETEGVAYKAQQKAGELYIVMFKGQPWRSEWPCMFLSLATLIGNKMMRKGESKSLSQAALLHLHTCQYTCTTMMMMANIA